MIREITLRGIAALLIAIAALFALHRAVWLPLSCARAAAIGEAELANAGGASYLKQRAGEHVVAMLSDCNAAFPADVRVVFARAFAYENVGDEHAAVAEYQRALTIDRRPEIYLALGMAQLRALDRPHAIDTLVRACQFDPAVLIDIGGDDELRKEVFTRCEPEAAKLLP